MRAALFLFLISLSSAAAAQIRLNVDARDAQRNILHAQERITVQPGPVTLAYPKWLPGNHRPSGMVQNLTGLRIEANGKALDWQRDPIEMFSIHVQAPSGARELNISFDAITDEGVAGSSGAAASTHVLDVNWNMVVLYPADAAADAVQVTPSLRLPDEWKFGSALEVASQNGSEITFKPVSLTMLIDSPLIAGDHFKRVVLDRDHDPIQHAIDMVAESEEDLTLTDKQTAALNNLITQTGKLFGARHYRHYDLLLTLSSQVGGRGLEHHESSDNNAGEKYLVEPQRFMANGSLMTHEFTHSWNGKYRRPQGLATKNYQQPMIGDLLWVYEGLTEYLGNVLAARSEFWTPEQYRESLADTAAHMDYRSGRRWRPLEDTAVSVQSLRLQGPAWQNWRRGLDYYPEGELIWLDVDTKIRELSSGKKSIDDFCHLFHGGTNGPPKVVPYDFNQLVAALNQTQPFDWATFLHDRVDRITEHAPLGGIEAGGWKLVYTDKPNVFMAAGEHQGGGRDLMFSLGFTVSRDAKIGDVVMDSPAYKAGLAPHMTILGVNGRKYSMDALKAAMESAKQSHKPITFVVENADFLQSYEVSYFDGLRYPHLERVEAKPDVLGEIIKAR